MRNEKGKTQHEAPDSSRRKTGTVDFVPALTTVLLFCASRPSRLKPKTTTAATATITTIAKAKGKGRTAQQQHTGHGRRRACFRPPASLSSLNGIKKTRNKRLNNTTADSRQQTENRNILCLLSTLVPHLSSREQKKKNYRGKRGKTTHIPALPHSGYMLSENRCEMEPTPVLPRRK